VCRGIELVALHQKTMQLAYNLQVTCRLLLQSLQLSKHLKRQHVTFTIIVWLGLCNNSMVYFGKNSVAENRSKLYSMHLLHVLVYSCMMYDKRMVEFSNAKNCNTFYALKKAFKEWHWKIWSCGKCGGCCVPKSLGKLSP